MTKRILSRLVLACSLSVATTVSAGAADDPDVERGRYLVQIMDCGGCHTRGIFLGKPDPALFLAGSEVGFHLPGLGVVYPPNLTPDAETGLGTWSDDDIIRAVRTGERPDGRILAPVMPWRSYAALNDDDARALVAYLKSLPAVSWPEEPQMAGEGQMAPGPYLTVAMP